MGVRGYIMVRKGLYKGCLELCIRLYRDDAKENGNYYLLRVPLKSNWRAACLNCHRVWVI